MQVKKEIIARSKDGLIKKYIVSNDVDDSSKIGVTVQDGEMLYPFQGNSIAKIKTVGSYTIYAKLFNLSYAIVKDNDVVYREQFTLEQAEKIAGHLDKPIVLENKLPFTKKGFPDSVKVGTKIKIYKNSFYNESFSKEGTAVVSYIGKNVMNIKFDNRWVEPVCLRKEHFEWDGKVFNAFYCRTRLLNEKEKQACAEWQGLRNMEEERICAMTDSSNEFYRKLYFFQDRGLEYMMGSSEDKEFNDPFVSEYNQRGMFRFSGEFL